MSLSLSQKALEISHRHGSPAREQVGSVFRILSHNYLFGIKRDDIVKSLADRFVKGESLQTIFNSMPFFNQRHKADALTLSKMVTDTDRWTVRFAEIILLDREDALKALSYWEPIDQIGIVLLFLATYGSTQSALYKFLKLFLAGMVVSEARSLTSSSYTFGTGNIVYTIGGNLLKTLFSRRMTTYNTVSLVIIMLSIPAGLWIDPPRAASNYMSGVYSDHFGRAVSLAVGWFLPV
jgi:hypothetical protein